MSLQIKWLGQGGFEIKTPETTVFVDPYFSDIGKNRLILPPYDMEKTKPDLLIATHDHLDHLDYGYVEIMDKTGVTFAGPDSCIKHFKELGVDGDMLVTLNGGSSIIWKDLIVTTVYANHTEDSVGVIVTYDNKKLYITGDTELNGRLGKDTAVHGITHMFVCINGRLGNMDIKDAVTYSVSVMPHVVYPMHYGMFASNTADPTEFIKAAGDAGLTAKELVFGEYMDL